ncbi:hypothetical protein BZA77DRAFT_299877 [Pyronema omphalodes]|nr:hypothetical protein BZA77DRAFT_299877 [Pyronema omphalodes]
MTEPTDSPSTTYHLYVTGAIRANTVLYTTPDHELPADAVIVKNPDCLGHQIRQLFGKSKSKKQTQIVVDDPNSDPRKPSYYLHNPRIWFKSPPETLRVGGKDGPVVCLLESSFFWRRWTLDFVVPEKDEPGFLGWFKIQRTNKSKEEKQSSSIQTTRIDSGFDESTTLPSSCEKHDDSITEGHGISLNDPGVMDPRGVISSHYPPRSYHLPGETGKAYIKNKICTKPQEDLPPHLDASQPRLVCYWNGWWTREYAFRYGNIELKWKGTGTVRDDRKYWGRWLRYNHLKLVAYLPLGLDPGSESQEGEVDEKKGTDDGSGMRMVVLAKYTSLLADRKVGRLAVFENGLEECFQDAIEKERFRHVVVATALCMIKGEKEKRETIRAIIELTVAGGEAGA